MDAANEYEDYDHSYQPTLGVVGCVIRRLLNESYVDQSQCDHHQCREGVSLPTEARNSLADG